MKILVFAGCLHKDSINKKLAKIAAKKLQDQGYEVSLVDVNNYHLPLYSQDIAAKDFPKEANLFASLMKNHSAWVIASPENNFTITAYLKNLIDWISRTPDNQKPNMEIFSNKTIAIMSASPSSLGGFRGLTHLRDILNSLGSFVIPSQVCIANSFSAIDENGNLIEKNNQNALNNMLQQLVNIGTKLQ